MQSRPAAERPSRLSLLPLVQDLDEAAAGQPAAPPPGPKSEMEWDEEEAPRAQEKVRELFLQVLSRRKRHAAAVAAAMERAKAKAKAVAMAKTEGMQEVDHSATSTIGHESSVRHGEKIKRGSIQNARRGIEERRKLEVSF